MRCFQATTLQTTLAMTSEDHQTETEVVCEREWRLIINTVAAGALCLIGLFGNTASYRVLGRDTEILPVPRFLFWYLKMMPVPKVLNCVLQLVFQQQHRSSYDAGPKSASTSVPSLVFRNGASSRLSELVF